MSPPGRPNVTVLTVLNNIQYLTPNCHTFFKKKLQKSVTIWEHLPKRYNFCTIIKQKKRKKV